MNRATPFICISSAIILSGCANSDLPRSVAGGECRIFSPPDYAIRGKYRIDQLWIDDTEEAGISGCGWPRPQIRPAAMPVKAPPMVAPGSSPAVRVPLPTPKPSVVVTKTETKKSLRDRIKKLNNEIRRLRGATPK